MARCRTCGERDGMHANGCEAAKEVRQLVQNAVILRPTKKSGFICPKCGHEPDEIPADRRAALSQQHMIQLPAGIPEGVIMSWIEPEKPGRKFWEVLCGVCWNAYQAEKSARERDEWRAHAPKYVAKKEEAES